MGPYYGLSQAKLQPITNIHQLFTFDHLNQKRVTKDINELQLPSTCKTEFEDPDDLLNFQLIICPDEGFYRGGRFVFNFKVGNNYPHEPPKVING